VTYSGIIQGLRDIGQSFKPFVSDSFNLELIIPEQGDILYNPDTGNYEPSEQTEFIYQARVKELRNNLEKNVVGSSYNRIRLTGYLVNPVVFKEELPNQVQAKLLNDGLWLSGLFFRELSLENELVESFQIRQVLGDKITGYFELIDNLNN
jgi:hypothetical protein